MALLHPYLVELQIEKCIEDGLQVISGSLSNLTSLSICYSRSVSSKDLDSLSKLTNLEKIDLNDIEYLDDAAVVNYSTLTKMNSITVSYLIVFCHGLSGLGLSYLVANKEFLVQLTIDYYGISSVGYHCLATLTNLTYLTARNCELDDFGLNMISSSCLLIEYLDIRGNGHITVEGLNNIHCLTHLNTLLCKPINDDWLAKLSHNTALTHLDLSFSVVSIEGLSHLSSLSRLKNLVLKGCRNIHDNSSCLEKFSFPITIIFYK
jgi:Leucine-rich repeat (LRR) protein